MEDMAIEGGAIEVIDKVIGVFCLLPTLGFCLRHHVSIGTHFVHYMTPFP